MQITLYSIVDEHTGETVARGLRTLAQAEELLALIKLDYPHSVFSIESHTAHVRVP